MNMLAKKTLIRSLASACFLGSSCCSAMLFGQQLQPKSSQAVDDDLPPIVSSVTANSAEQVPAVVSVNELMPTDVGIQPFTTGKNFPSDAQRRIAEFVQQNGNATVANTAYAAPAGLPPSDAMSNAGYQDSSPSDVPVVPVPAPNGVTLPAVPSIGGQSAMDPSYVTPPMASPMQDQMGSPMMDQGYPDQGYPDQGYPAQNYMPVSPSQPIINSQSQGYAGSSNYFEPMPSSGSQIADYGPISDTFACCGFVCDSRRYMVIDGLYWQRGDGVFRASNMNPLNDFEFTWGGRITVGNKRDGTRGFEASYMHFDPWLATTTQADPGGSLIGAIFESGGANGFPAGTFTAFRNSTLLQQFHKTDLNGLELNKTWWGSDVAKAFIGTRFIHFDDEFHLASNGAGGFGQYNIDATNNMFGLHIGGELLYDIGYRLAFSLSGKLGGYANFYDASQFLQNGASVLLSNNDDGTDLAYSAELGVTARYKINQNTRLRIGYDLFALLDVYEVESNFQSVVTPASGLDFREGDAFFHGATIGIEFYR